MFFCPTRSGAQSDPQFYESLKSKGRMTQGIRTIDGQPWARFVSTAERAAASRGTGSQQTTKQWVLAPFRPPMIIARKPVVATPKPRPKVPILPTDKVTNAPNGQPNTPGGGYQGPSRLHARDGTGNDPNYPLPQSGANRHRAQQEALRNS